MIGEKFLAWTTIGKSPVGEIVVWRGDRWRVLEPSGRWPYTLLNLETGHIQDVPSQAVVGVELTSEDDTGEGEENER
jgi:hypothetical protein